MELKEADLLIKSKRIDSKRYSFIDISKGLGIVLVVLGHMNIPEGLYNYIYSFHMPLFVLLSGFIFDETKFWKNARQLFISFLSATTIITVMTCIFRKTLFPIRQYLFALLGGGAAPYYHFDLSPAVWFIACLIIIELLSWAINKFASSFKLFFCVGSIIIGLFLGKIKSISWCPWNIDVALFLFPLFELGHSFSNYKRYFDEIPNRTKPVFLILGVILLFVQIPLSKVNGTVNIYRCNYGKSITLYYLSALSGSLAIVFLSSVLSSFVSHKLLDWIGRNTLIPMCIHQPLLSLMPLLMGYLPYYNAVWYRLGTVIFELILVLLISFFFSYIVKRYCPFLLGIGKGKF